MCVCVRSRDVCIQAGEEEHGDDGGGGGAGSSSMADSQPCRSQCHRCVQHMCKSTHATGQMVNATDIHILVHTHTHTAFPLIMKITHVHGHSGHPEFPPASFPPPACTFLSASRKCTNCLQRWDDMFPAPTAKHLPGVQHIVGTLGACVCACVRACMRARVCVCVCVCARACTPRH